MVRDAIARQGHTPGEEVPAQSGFRAHASHGLLTLVRGGDPDGQCLIEPAVRCNHCGYCQSMGH